MPKSVQTSQKREIWNHKQRQRERIYTLTGTRKLVPNWVRLKQLDQTAEYTWDRSDNGILHTIRNDATASLCIGNPGQLLEIYNPDKMTVAIGNPAPTGAR